MESTTIPLVLGSLDVILGLLFSLIGIVVGKRAAAKGEGYFPLLTFSAWWHSAGVLLIMTGVVALADSLWRPDFALHITLVLVRTSLGIFALFCLTYYFLHLFVGPNRLWIAVAFFYAFSGLALVYMINYQRPVGLDVQVGTVNVVFANEFAGLAITEKITILLFVPPILGLVGYAFLFKRVPSNLQRFRIAAIFAILIALFGSSLAIRIFNPEPEFPLILGSRVLAIAGMGFLLLSYRPTLTLQQWLERPTS